MTSPSPVEQTDAKPSPQENIVLASDTMQRNTSINTFIVLAFLTLLAYFFAYATNMTVSGMLDVNPLETNPALDRSGNASSSGQREDTSLDKDINAGIPAESSPEFNNSIGQTSGTAGSLKDTTWSFPVRALDRTFVLASMKNMNEVLKQARAVPVLRHGKTAGLRISGISPGSFYEKIGLQNGDIIIQIDKRNLDNPSGFLKLYQELKNRQYISIVLYRHGHQQTLNYDIH